MALVSWPPDIGFCMAEGYEGQWPDLITRSEVDSGPAKQRRIATSGPDVVTCAYYMKTAERDWLRDFYMGPAAGGAVWFEWLDPVDLVIKPARFMKGQPPKVRPMRPNWVVLVTLEVRPSW